LLRKVVGGAAEAAGPFQRPILRERNKRLWLVSTPLCAAAVVTATAAPAAPARSGQSRDNAIRECVAEAKAAAPCDQITYKNCMWKKGLRP
jgi:hypothetical protein